MAAGPRQGGIDRIIGEQYGQPTRQAQQGQQSQQTTGGGGGRTMTVEMPDPMADTDRALVWLNILQLLVLVYIALRV
jgi:hypothetical protein